MRIVKGNKTIEYTTGEFLDFVKSWEKVVLDLGTGDGRYVYKNAKIAKDILWIGIDPSEKQLQEYSKKSLKEGLGNVLFVLSSLENIEKDFEGVSEFVDDLKVYLPWGSLLEHIIKATPTYLNNLRSLCKTDANFEVVLGYTEEAEPTEVDRLGLSEISEAYFEKIKPLYKECGWYIREITLVSKEILGELDTTWGKRLKFGANRPMYKLTGIIN
ncbi:MAG: class I SAM-dependent methyltransferase [Patescibacteria group bacterium]